MNYRIQVITVPVGDVDQALAFYTTNAGRHPAHVAHRGLGRRLATRRRSVTPRLRQLR